MQHTILLIDDERDYVEAMGMRLELRGFSPLYATGGREGIAVAEEMQPQAIVLDLRMPDIDGIEVLKHVRSHLPDAQVVILTGHGTEADRAFCMELGAVAFYNKPINIDVLVQTLRDAMEIQ